MKDGKENKEDRFRRLAEARVNKLIAMLRLLGNLSCRDIYTYTREQVDQIFNTLQLELVNAKMRFLQEGKRGKKRFSLSNSYEESVQVPAQDTPTMAIPLPDGTYLRAVGYPNDDYPSVNIYWDNGINAPTDTLCFVEFNPEKEGRQRVCIGVYCAEQEDTTYYGPYCTVERSQDE